MHSKVAYCQKYVFGTKKAFITTYNLINALI